MILEIFVDLSEILLNEFRYFLDVFLPEASHS